jgi:BlaI family transcriptional regulator, penicillinase repressor
MVRPTSEHPTELELELLKILWRESPLAVRDVRAALAAAGRDLAHTSVITTLNVMVRKKYLRRSMQGNACLFAPRISRQDASRRMLGDIVNRVFDGSAKAVVLSLFD